MKQNLISLLYIIAAAVLITFVLEVVKISEPLYLTAVIAIATFVFGVIKWLDQREREEEDKRFLAFHKILLLASGVNEQGAKVVDTQQIVAVYQLQNYKQYAFAALPALKMMRDRSEYEVHVTLERKYFLSALEETINNLTPMKNKLGVSSIGKCLNGRNKR